MKNLKQIIILVIAGVLGVFFYLDFSQYLSLEHIKEQQTNFLEFYKENTLLAMGAFTGVYIVSTALSLPGAVLLTLLGGALFGLLVSLFRRFARCFVKDPVFSQCRASASYTGNKG